MKTKYLRVYQELFKPFSDSSYAFPTYDTVRILEELKKATIEDECLDLSVLSDEALRLTQSTLPTKLNFFRVMKEFTRRKKLLRVLK